MLDNLLHIPEQNVWQNCRIEEYPTHLKLTVANRAAFKDKAFEERDPKPRTKTPKPQNKENAPQPRSKARAIKKVRDIALLNEDLRYFITLTIDPKKADRTNPREASRAVQRFFRNRVQRLGIKYLVIPEYHKDGAAIHLHGLVSEGLKLVNSGKTHSNGSPIYNLPEWTLGFSTCVELDTNRERAVNYLSKYITKDTEKIFGNFYYRGGRLISRPSTTYTDVDFDTFEADATYTVPGTPMQFKYLRVDKGVTA